MRQRLAQVFANRFEVHGFVPLGCDGSRLACPRTAELQNRLTPSQKSPQVWVTAIVHLSLGILWSWRLGRGDKASERSHLRQLLPTLPARALLVTDAGYPGYEVLQALAAHPVAFLMRLSSVAPLYSIKSVALSSYKEGLVYYWPKDVQKDQRPPLTVRLMRIVGSKGDVWLITNVRLTLASSAKPVMVWCPARACTPRESRSPTPRFLAVQVLGMACCKARAAGIEWHMSVSSLKRVA
jgi:hypothetical protein